jgi:hypothetical protein
MREAALSHLWFFHHSIWRGVQIEKLLIVEITNKLGLYAKLFCCSGKALNI